MAKANSTIPIARRIQGKITVEYRTWKRMRERCRKELGYADRGISVCKAWDESFECFLADVGCRPGPGYSLGRIDNSGNYEPGNVAWMTAREQARNRRNNRPLTFNGETLLLIEWSERTGLSEAAIYTRLKLGWTVEQALATPLWGNPRRNRL